MIIFLRLLKMQFRGVRCQRISQTHEDAHYFLVFIKNTSFGISDIESLLVTVTSESTQRIK